MQPGRYAPREFTAVIEDEGSKITLGVEIVERRARCKRLEVEATVGDVTGEVLRRIAVTRYVDMALGLVILQPHRIEDLSKVMSPELAEGVADHLREIGQSETFMDITDAERASFYEQHAGSGRRPQRGSPVTDENLTQVAGLYRDALARGLPPTQTIAETMHVARSTAARWVGLARKRGLLGASLPGRAGEADSETSGKS